MFGYVSIYKDELKIKDYDTFRAYYCGLCKALGKHHGHAVRFGLSYDMTFLSLLLSSLEEEEVFVSFKRCMAHPFKKRKVIEENPYIRYGADMSVLLTYHKLRDDLKDEKSIKALFALLFYAPLAKKVEKKYKKESEEIFHLLDALSQMENENSYELDCVADCFANILKILFTPDFLSEDNKKILGWMGYNLGRWIYIIDAYKDIEEDIQKKNYNPFKEGKNTENIEFSLTLTLEAIAKSYELLNIKRNDEILRNIIYLGLRGRQDAILHGGNNGSV